MPEGSGGDGGGPGGGVICPGGKVACLQYFFYRHIYILSIICYKCFAFNIFALAIPHPGDVQQRVVFRAKTLPTHI